MLSDEEKEAIQMIKNQKENIDEALIAMEIPENYMGEDIEQEYLEWQKNAETILNLIEKQSKEIEELKEEDDANLAYYDQIYQNGIYTGQKAVEDKIKAKIEEYKEKCKNCNFRGKICNEFIKNYECTIGVCLKEFYSLLEKE